MASRLVHVRMVSIPVTGGTFDDDPTATMTSVAWSVRSVVARSAAPPGNVAETAIWPWPTSRAEPRMAVAPAASKPFTCPLSSG